MKMQKIITALLCVLFVLLLLFSVAVTAVTVVCTPKAIERRLDRGGFYTLAAECIKTEIEDLQSVIGIPTDDVLATVPYETVKALLKPYVLAVSEQLLHGGAVPAEIQFESDALATLVASVVTVEQYGDDTAQMEEDRAAAYADLTAAINDTLTFFPATLFDTAMGIVAGEKATKTLYAAVRLARILVLPGILATVLCGGCILLYRRNTVWAAAKTVAGCFSVTSAVLFFCALFTFAGNHLLDKFSLSDGLLRRYILALFHNAATSIITVTAVCFAVSVILLGIVIVHIAVKTPCTDEKTVLE